MRACKARPPLTVSPSRRKATKAAPRLLRSTPPIFQTKLAWRRRRVSSRRKMPSNSQSSEFVLLPLPPYTDLDSQTSAVGASGANTKSTPPSYRAPSGNTPKPPRIPSDSTAIATTRSREELTLTIDLRVMFIRGGTCSITLLPRSVDGTAPEISVKTAQGPIELITLEEGWYQDVQVADLGQQLRGGIEWRSVDPPARWILSGRDIFVLGQRSELCGNVTRARLSLGRDQLVLCVQDIYAAVEETLRDAGCDSYQVLTASDGVPDGWLLIRNVRPQRSVRLNDEADILNILRPQPEIDIAFEGGVRFSRNSWLAGVPPVIRVYGAEHGEPVYIDDEGAHLRPDESYVTASWDAVGKHFVACGQATRTYSIEKIQEAWDLWVAHDFLATRGRVQTRTAVCGPLVLSSIDEVSDFRRSIVVAAAAPVLIGKNPGEVYVATEGAGRVASWRVGWPLFEPIWAMPENPLRCDKRHALLRFLPSEFGDLTAFEPGLDAVESPELWSRAVLDCRRKGLRPDSTLPSICELWCRYVHRARALWKAAR